MPLARVLMRRVVRQCQEVCLDYTYRIANWHMIKHNIDMKP